MNGIVIGIASGLAVLFLGWLARTIFLSRRLYLIQPKLFDYSDISNANNSKTLEITVLNSGSRSEENIEVQFSPVFTYTVVASNTAGLKLDDKAVLKIERLAPKQDATVILTAEGGEFRKDHIVGVSSKETVGRVKTSLSEAKLTPLDNFLMPLIFFLVLPGIGYFVGNFIVDEVWPSIRPIASIASEEKEIVFKVENEKIEGTTASKSAMQKYKGTYKVAGVTRVQDIVTVQFSVTNNTDDRIEYTLISTSPVSELRDKYPGAVDYANTTLVFPKVRKVISVSDYLPQDVEPQLLSIRLSIDGSKGRGYIEQDVVLQEE
jgi:hypothetical protein